MSTPSKEGGACPFALFPAVGSILENVVHQAEMTIKAGDSNARGAYSSKNVPGLWDAITKSLESPDADERMRSMSKAQAILLREGQRWGPLMRMLYMEEINQYFDPTTGGRDSTSAKYFSDRIEKLGKTFCAFGQVNMNAHEDVKKYVLGPQQRAGRIYPMVIMQKDFVENGTLFPLFLSDKAVGGDGSREVLKEAMRTLVSKMGVAERQVSEHARSLVGNLVRDVYTPGSNVRALVMKFVVHYVHYVMLDMDLSKPEFAAIADDDGVNFFCNQGSAAHCWLSRVWPLDGCGLTAKIAARKGAQIRQIYEKSDIVQKIWPRQLPSNPELSLSSWAENVVDIICLAPVFGFLATVGTILRAKHPLPSPDDEVALRNHYYEYTRWEAPVPYTTQVATEKFSAMIGGEKFEFPVGTPIAVGIGSANLDPKVFPNPEVFNPENTVKCPYSTSFSWLGDNISTRGCLGRGIAERLGKDVLIAKAKFMAAAAAAAKAAATAAPH